MRISIFGVGYVGLVTGVCFAEMGNEVTCCDIDSRKIEMLKDGRSPIFEPGLDELIKNNLVGKRVVFTTDSAVAVSAADVIFIAVGTPSDTDGSSDLKYVLSVARTIGQKMTTPKVVIVKSTVPVGTCLKVKEAIQNELATLGKKIEFDVVSNPEFLKEGTAISDCLRPNRVVVGFENPQVKGVMGVLYAPFFPKDNQQVFYMDLASAELTKYAANAMLATRISFMNDLSQLCEKVGADIEQIRLGIGSDTRIGTQFLYAGIGYGGSCFPKDIRALLKTGEVNGHSLRLLDAVEKVNADQRVSFFRKLEERFGGQLAGRKFAVWGLSFKPGTDDIREAPAIDLLKFLAEKGAESFAYDPEGLENSKQLLGDKKGVHFVTDQYEALKDCDALIVVTEWKSFRTPDFEKVKALLKKPIIFDGRNIYDSGDLSSKGFTVYRIGKKA